MNCCWTCRTCRDNEIVSLNRTSCEVCPAFYWPNGNATSCIPIDPTYLRVSHPISVSLLVMASLGVVSTAVVANIYFARSRNKLVMATNLPLSIITLTGILTGSIAVILFVTPPTSTGVCITRSFGFHCSVNLIYVPLFIKNVLIYRIFTAGVPNIAFKSTKIQILSTISGFILQVSCINLV
jgi:7 transmembrane sweet-taste receptor of 3 GCPR